MATTKKAPTRAKLRNSSAPAPKPEGRKESMLTRVGNEAKAAAQRALLLKTLKAHDWNLTHTAGALEMPGPSQVIRAIHELGLDAEYESARSRGSVSRGRPAES